MSIRQFLEQFEGFLRAADVEQRPGSAQAEVEVVPLLPGVAQKVFGILDVPVLPQESLRFLLMPGFYRVHG